MPAIHESLGWGFIIDETGLILTNAHVVAGARSDLAELRIDARTVRMPFVRFGRSRDVRPGQRVVAIGNPFGLGGSVSAGIVSASNRDLGTPNPVGYIQTDAAINPNNSAGRCSRQRAM